MKNALEENQHEEPKKHDMRLCENQVALTMV